VSAGTYDDANAAWVFTGDWGTYYGAGPYLSTLHYSATVGNIAEVQFIGEQFQLTYTALADRGVVEQKWSSDPMPPGLHALRLVHVSGGVVDLDALTVIATANILGAGKYDAGEALLFTSNWYTYHGAGPYADSLHFSISPKESAQFSFVGEQFTLYYTQLSDRGVLDVYIDGVKVASVDESGTGAWQQTWTSEPLPAGQHNVRLVQASSSGVVDIDAIEIIPTATVLSAGTYDDVHPAWHYSTYWYTYEGSEPYGNSLHFSINPKDEALVSFHGTQFQLIYTQMTDRGMLDIYVDGMKVATLNENGTGGWQQMWTSDSYAAGTHTVRLVHATGPITDIDAITVLP
jgi:hypothetical protein